MKTGSGSQTLLEFPDGLQMALNVHSVFLFSLAGKTARDLSGSYVCRPERFGSKSLEIETSGATAAVKETEIANKVLPDGGLSRGWKGSWNSALRSELAGSKLPYLAMRIEKKCMKQVSVDAALMSRGLKRGLKVFDSSHYS